MRLSGAFMLDESEDWLPEKRAIKGKYLFQTSMYTQVQHMKQQAFAANKLQLTAEEEEQFCGEAVVRVCVCGEAGG